MEESGIRIFQASAQVINRLQLLSLAFEEELLVRILIRTQVIHKLFENNPELDVHKLELFHLQFSESIINLLRQVKKNNEKAYQSLLTELEANNALIEKLTAALREEGSFDHEKEVQATRVSKVLEGLFQNFSDYARTNPFPKDIGRFGVRFAQEYFVPLPETALGRLLDYEPENVYRNAYGVVDRKLMGAQCRELFQNRFVCGLKAGNTTAEIYKLKDRELFFVFCAGRSVFLPCSTEMLDEIQPGSPQSAKGKMVSELTEKSLLLEEKSRSVRKQLPADVKQLLTEYHDKIAGIDFLDLIDDYDIQANILKTMLNTDSI